MCGLEVLNLASNNFESLESVKGLADLLKLRNLNLLSTPLFVMKQKDEKEKIRQTIINMLVSLRILNCEELYTAPIVVQEKPIEGINICFIYTYSSTTTTDSQATNY